MSLEFVSQRLDSWQLHLEELSCYLVEGEGVWWRDTDGGQVFEFLDTQKDHDKPELKHYRTSDFMDIKATKMQAWETIMNPDILLPTPSIDCNGSFNSRKRFLQYTSAANQEMDTETTTSTTCEIENMDIISKSENDHISTHSME